MAYYMYVSIQEEDRIAIFSMTPKTGKLKHQGDAELQGRPAPMAMDPDQKYLFAGRRKADDYDNWGRGREPSRSPMRYASWVERIELTDRPWWLQFPFPLT